MNLLKKYWDILGGFATGIGLSFLVKFELGKIQIIYSVIILILVSIGVFRIVKQTVEKNRARRPKKRNNIIDGLVDSQKPVKAISLAQHPMFEGEKVGNLLMETLKGISKIMKKLKEFFDKFKGYLLSIALGVLTLIEYFGGYINACFEGKLSVNGFDILPVITLVCAIIVGIISNGWSKEQLEKIRALFSSATSNELVKAKIKEKLKDCEGSLKDRNKVLETKQNELDNLNTALANAKNSYNATLQMSKMTPRLATDEEVSLAIEAIKKAEEDIKNKQTQIDSVAAEIANLSTTINALKSQL